MFTGRPPVRPAHPYQITAGAGVANTSTMKANYEVQALANRKTVYTSSILVVASINIINGLHRLLVKPQEVPRARLSRRRTSLREME